MTIYNINFELGVVSVDGTATHDKSNATLALDLNYTIDGSELQKIEMVFNNAVIDIDQRYIDNGDLVNYAYLICHTDSQELRIESTDSCYTSPDGWAQIKGVDDKYQNAIAWMTLQVIVDQEYAQSISGDGEL